MQHEPLISPRLTALRRAIDAGNEGSVPTFWGEMARQGTPLVEPDPHDAASALVTLLWRGDAGARNVAVLGAFGSYFDLAGNTLAHLPGTDVWYRTDRVRADVRAWYRLAPNDSLEPPRDWGARTAAFRADHLNPRRFVVPGGPENLATPHTEVWSVIELPDTPPQPWVQADQGVPRGDVHRRRVPSDLLGDERDVWVYTPPGYAPDSAPYGLLVLSDGFIYTHVIPTPTILDNLCAASRLPPLVAVMVNHPDADARVRELSCYEPFVDFLAHELLPWVHARYRVTDDPTRTMIGGSSLGGLTASFAALRHPDVFGAALSQSGSYWWRPQGEEPGWLSRQYAAAVHLPLRFYLDVGILESDGQRAANRHMRDVVEAKGCPVRYAEFSGGHTFLCWQGTLSDGLMAVMGTSDGV
jgi:enterochelin esterase-like enzyme